MAKRPVATSMGVAASERDVLLATKLYLPQPQPGFVPRPRLVDVLEDALAGGLVLVFAPAGFGKTALLGDWVRRGGRAVAWLSLDAGDSDPARFWRQVVAALDRARPGIAERAAPLLGPPAPPSFEGLVTALINELAAAPAESELLLVLDDYHLIDSAPVHASLMFLLEHLPQGLHLVLASGPTRRWPWRGCGRAGSSRSCALPSCASPRARPRLCCAKRPGPSCPRMPLWP